MFRVEVFTVHGEMGVGGFLLHNSCSVISFLVEALFQWGCWAQVCCMRACPGGTKRSARGIATIMTFDFSLDGYSSQGSAFGFHEHESED